MPATRHTDVDRGRTRLLLIAVVMLTVVGETGCVRRRLIIVSNPPGAQVYVDNYRIGTTPCATPFTFYGTREIRLVKDGYETKTVLQPIPPPWYQIPPLDFVSENLIPLELRDVRTVTYTLQPQILVPIPQLLARAEQLRSAGGAGSPQNRLAAPPQQLPPGGVAVPPPSAEPPAGAQSLPVQPPVTEGAPTMSPPATVPPTPAASQPWPRY